MWKNTAMKRKTIEYATKSSLLHLTTTRFGEILSEVDRIFILMQNWCHEKNQHTIYKLVLR